MMYYGFILFAMRRSKRIDNLMMKKDASDNDDPFARIDKLMFVIYLVSFVIYNIVHLSNFFEKMM